MGGGGGGGGLCFFFFNDPATTEIYTLSLHDALPICSAFLVIFNFCFIGLTRQLSLCCHLKIMTIFLFSVCTLEYKWIGNTFALRVVFLNISPY